MSTPDPQSPFNGIIIPSGIVATPPEPPLDMQLLLECIHYHKGVYEQLIQQVRIMESNRREPRLIQGAKDNRDKHKRFYEHLTKIREHLIKS